MRKNEETVVDEKVSFGSGIKVIKFDFKNKIFNIDFEISEDNDFGICGSIINPGTILFFAANSYKQNFYIIKQRIDEILNNNQIDKKNELITYIMPLLFSFRHHIELLLKGLIINVFNIKYEDSHNLMRLANKFKQKLENTENTNHYSLDSQTYFSTVKNRAIEDFNEIVKDISRFTKIEGYNEYFRYLVGRELNIDKHVLHFNYNTDIPLMLGLMRKLYKFKVTIHSIKPFYQE